MTDQAAAPDRIVGWARVRRWLGLAAMSFLATPYLAVFVYLVLIYVPDPTLPSGCGGSAGTWFTDRDAWEWMALSAILVAGATCYGVALGRWTSTGRWWPWPLAACVLIVAGANASFELLTPGPFGCPPGG